MRFRWPRRRAVFIVAVAALAMAARATGQQATSGGDAGDDDDDARQRAICNSSQARCGQERCGDPTRNASSLYCRSDANSSATDDSGAGSADDANATRCDAALRLFQTAIVCGDVPLGREVVRNLSGNAPLVGFLAVLWGHGTVQCALAECGATAGNMGSGVLGDVTSALASRAAMCEESVAQGSAAGGAAFASNENVDRPTYEVYSPTIGARRLADGHYLTLPLDPALVIYWVVSAAFFALALLIPWAALVAESMGATLTTVTGVTRRLITRRDSAPGFISGARVWFSKQRGGRCSAFCAAFSFRNGRKWVAKRQPLLRQRSTTGAAVACAAVFALLVAASVIESDVSDTIGTRLPNALDGVDTWAERAVFDSDNVTNATAGVLTAARAATSMAREAQERASFAQAASSSIGGFSPATQTILQSGMQSATQQAGVFGQTQAGLNTSITLLKSVNDQLLSAVDGLNFAVNNATASARSSIQSINSIRHYAVVTVLTFCGATFVAFAAAFVFFQAGPSGAARMLRHHAELHVLWRFSYAPVFSVATLLLVALAVLHFVVMLGLSTFCAGPEATVYSVLESTGLAGMQIPVEISPTSTPGGTWANVLNATVDPDNGGVECGRGGATADGGGQAETCSFSFNNTVTVGELTRFYIECGEKPGFVNPLRPTLALVNVLVCLSTSAVTPMPSESVYGMLWAPLTKSMAGLRDSLTQGRLTRSGNQEGGLLSVLSCSSLNQPIESVELLICTTALPKIEVELAMTVLLFLAMLAMELAGRLSEAAIKTEPRGGGGGAYTKLTNVYGLDNGGGGESDGDGDGDGGGDESVDAASGETDGEHSFEGHNYVPLVDLHAGERRASRRCTGASETAA